MLMSCPDCMKNLAPSTARHFGPQALDDLVGGHVALVMRLQLNEQPRGVLGRVVRAGAGKSENTGHGGILPDDLDDLGA